MSITTTEHTTAALASVIDKQIQAAGNLTSVRRAAFDALQTHGLPGNKAEEYKHTHLTRALEKHFDLSQAPGTSGEVALRDFAIPGLEANILVFVNGVFDAGQSKVLSPAQEVTILPLRDAIQKKSNVVEQYLGQYADTSDAFAAWNTAAFHDGVFIEVGNNTQVQLPIVVYHLHDARQQQVMSATRNLFVVGLSSDVTVVEKFDSIGATPHFSSLVTEVIVGENAGFNLYSIQNDQGARYQHNTIHIQQSNASRGNTYTFTLDGKFVRNNLQLVLDGEGIESHMYGLYLLSKDIVGDNHTVVDHKKPNSFSNELYKGIMDDSAKGVFNGKIYVRPQAQKTNAFQANRNILLTDKASVNTKPQLEIWADDVKCSHGCTSGQLDEEALFYLQARGISKETARAMMLYAFAGEILDNVRHEGLKTYLDNIISERLHKNF